MKHSTIQTRAGGTCEQDPRDASCLLASDPHMNINQIPLLHNERLLA